MSTETEPKFASDSARELAAENPKIELPKTGSAKDKSINSADVRLAIAKLEGDAKPVDQDEDAKKSSKSSGFGSLNYKGKQPWEDGGPKVAITHQLPTLSSGSDGPAVLELGSKLAKLGYETSLSRGENPFGVLDASVLTAVKDFRRDYGISEDPSGYPVPTDAGNHVGPYTWEALLGAVE